MINVVVGCCCGYDYPQIEPWVVSLEKTGYTGDKVLIAYNVTQNLVDILQKKNWKVFPAVNTVGNVCVNRFFNIHKFLQESSYQYIVTTDVKDVVFQENPFDILGPEIQSGYTLFLSSEGLVYKDEPWGKNNLIQSFGFETYNKLQNDVIVNAGVLGGATSEFSDLSFLIYQLCSNRPAFILGGGGPDQAALNLLTHTSLCNYNSTVVNDWVCQAGTLADPSKIDNFRPHLLLPEPKLNISGKVLTKQNKLYPVIHQYDRVPLWRGLLDQMYRE